MAKKPVPAATQDHSGAPTLTELRREAAQCRRCPLYRNATRTVFGEGGAHAAMVLVGEQPGDQEDRQGRPFVGPAGKILDHALEDAGIARKDVYVTNAVKHFKFEPRGKKRLHKRPDRGEIEACRWWLRAEIALIRPKLIVALGATAARALSGKALTIGRLRGTPLEFMGHKGFVTVHPSYLLRLPDREARKLEYRKFVRDLRLVAKEAERARLAA
ncbi:MAG: UdgX family uracil-DNA binding protein [Parvibaculaceae bacterium]